MPPFRITPDGKLGSAIKMTANGMDRLFLWQLGHHEPRIIPAIYVKPFVKGQKNDYNDAETIAEASLRPNLCTVRTGRTRRYREHRRNAY
jgi:transposase